MCCECGHLHHPHAEFHLEKSPGSMSFPINLSLGTLPPTSALSISILTSSPQIPHPTSHPFAYAKSFSSWACRGKMTLGSKNKSSLGPQEPYWWRNFKYLIIFVLSPLPPMSPTETHLDNCTLPPLKFPGQAHIFEVAASLCAKHICGMSSNPHIDKH